MPVRQMLPNTPLREFELAQKYEITFDDPNITALAEGLAEELRVRLFEDEGAMDDLLRDLVTEIVPASAFGGKTPFDLNEEDLDQLDEVKDLVQRLVFAHLQVLITRVFALGDWR